MARKRLQSWIVRRVVHLFSLCIFFDRSIICDTQHVPSSEEEGGIKHQNNFPSGVYLYTSNDVTIRVGQQLQLNCTVVRAVNSSKVQFSWYHGTQRLTNFTRPLNNKTVQLVINNVSWSDNGRYVCRERSSNRVQPVSVMVRVGDLPGPPQDVWINNVELRTYVHWKAPWYQGGLQLSYAVKARCKNASTPHRNCTLKDSVTLCEGIRTPQESESGQFMCTIRPILRQFYPGTFILVPYIAFVEASNFLGSRMSSPVEFTYNILSSVYTTPQPAVFLAAEEVTPPGTVKVSWEDARRGRFIEVEYTILYHKDGDSQNKSLTRRAPETNALIHDLVGFSRYHFYLLVRYAERNTSTYGVYSEPTQRTVRTDVSAPRDPPVIRKCSHWNNVSSDPGLRIIWRIPRAKYFSGPKRSAVILYSCPQGSGNVTVNDTSARSAVITAVKPSDSCHVWMKLCNEPGLCSSISNMCLAPSILKGNSSSGPTNSKNSVTKTVLMGVAGAVMGLVLVIITVACYRRGRAPLVSTKQESRPLRWSYTGRPRFTDFPSNLTNLIGREKETKTLRILRNSGLATERLRFLVLTKRSTASGEENDSGNNVGCNGGKNSGLLIRRRENGTQRQPLQNVLAMPPVIHGYDEVEEPLVNNNCYDVIAV